MATPTEQQPRDERLLLTDYVCPLPADTEELLARALGPERFAAYQQALPRAPAVTHVRVQHLSHNLEGADDSGGQAGCLTQPPLAERAATVVVAAESVPGASSVASEAALDEEGEAVMEAARRELEALLEPWAVACEPHAPPRPLVRRHLSLRDLLVVPSALGHATADAASGGTAAGPPGEAVRVVIVDRLCGEAVLKGR
jgi:hypothetical protein